MTEYLGQGIIRHMISKYRFLVLLSHGCFTGSAHSEISETSNPEVKGPASSFPKAPAHEWSEAQVFLKAT